MKKQLSLCIAIAMIFTLCSCSQDKKALPAKKANKGTEVASNKSHDETNNKSNDKQTDNKSNDKQNKESDFKAFSPIVLQNTSGLQTKKIGWSWKYSPRDNGAMLSKYHGYAFGDTSKKVIYLTFDEGYEYGYTPSILDTLKKNNVKAAFFCTKPFVLGSFNGVKDADLVKRMADEGHIIGNHTVHHLSMPSFLNEAAYDAELTGVEDTVKNIPGCKVSKFFRAPAGEFSELSLYYAQKLGYRSIFWAFAYNDYDVKNQPNPNDAKALILKNTQPGMICLLHAESKTNAEILDSLIKEWKNEGYEFRTLNDLN